MANKFVDNNGLLYIFTKIKGDFVAKEAGKGLSTNDFSTELLNKLNGIAAGAQVNVLEKVKVNGVEQTITEKAVDISVPTKTSEITNDSGYLSVVTEANLDAELAEKVNAAADGNHSHANKELLDTYTQTEANLADAVAKKHEHANKAELDLIESGDKAKWDKAVTDLSDEITRAKAAEAQALTDAKAYADGQNTAMDTRVKAIEDDYLKTADRTALQGNIDTLAGRVTSNEGAITTLNGNSSVEGSVDKKIADAINAFATQLTDDGTVNTYKEALDYIAAHGSEYTALLGVVQGNTAAIEAIAGDYVKASELVALTNSEIDEIYANA